MIKNSFFYLIEVSLKMMGGGGLCPTFKKRGGVVSLKKGGGFCRGGGGGAFVCSPNIGIYELNCVLMSQLKLVTVVSIYSAHFSSGKAIE